MNYTFLQVIGGIIALALGIFAWVKSASDEKKKAKADEDAKIDAIASADDVTRMADELRNK